MVTFVYYAFQLVSILINAYVLVIFINMVLSWLPQFNIGRIGEWTYRLTEPMLAPIRRIMPAFAGLDFSPAILIILLNIVQQGLNYAASAIISMLL